MTYHLMIGIRNTYSERTCLIDFKGKKNCIQFTTVFCFLGHTTLF